MTFLWHLLELFLDIWLITDDERGRHRFSGAVGVTLLFLLVAALVIGVVSIIVWLCR